MKNNYRKTEDLEERLISFFETSQGRYFRINDLGDYFNCRGKKRAFLIAAIHDLARRGYLSSKEGKYCLNTDSVTLEGKLEIARSGAGFVNDHINQKCYRIDNREVSNYLPGDIVEIRPTRGDANATEASILKLVKRSEKLITGTISIKNGSAFVKPISASYQRDLYVQDTKDAKDGDRVVLKCTHWSDDKYDIPTGEIVDVIGPRDNPSLDTELVVKEYELPGDFTEEELEEATNLGALLDDTKGRLDLRKSYIITIDPAASRDFDDAISLKIGKDGTRELGVHIADVSHFIRPGTSLDKEAKRRGNSVYLADKVIPMLPEQLSNGICSLRPREDRFCVSVFITYDKSAKVIKSRFEKTIIRSNLRLNYAQALAIIEKREAPGLKKVPKAAETLLQETANLALQLRKARLESGALDLDLPECRPIIDANGMITDFVIEEYDISHQMIEECMVAANEAVARYVFGKNGGALISRLHEMPDEAKLADLSVALESLGLRVGELTNIKNLTRFIASVRNHPLRTTIHTQILRSMKRALYSAEKRGHFGLSKDFYSHFTSPIRRYPDLVLHRQLSAIIENDRKTTFSKKELQIIAAHSTETEEVATEAERTLLEIKKYRYLEALLESGETKVFDAVISKVTSFGLFVDIENLQLGGLIHISTIDNDYVRHDKISETLHAKGKTYKAGDKLSVVVTKVDFDARRLDFVIHRPSKKKGK